MSSATPCRSAKKAAARLSKSTWVTDGNTNDAGTSTLAARVQHTLRRHLLAHGSEQPPTVPLMLILLCAT